MRKSNGVSVLGLMALFGVAATARSATIPLLTFENDEFAGDSSAAVNYGGTQSTAGVNGSGFGITEGSKSLLFNGYVPGSANFFNTTTNGSETGEPNANFIAFQQVLTRLNAGDKVTFSFDMAYNFAGVTTTGYFQPGLIFNSTGGYNGPAFGGLLQGNAGSGGNFPQVGNASGVSIQILDAVDYVTDFNGIVRVTATVGLPGSGAALVLGDGSNYYQVNMLSQGGYAGSSNISFDNYVFNTTPAPEPAGLAVASIAGVGLFRRQRRQVQ